MLAVVNQPRINISGESIPQKLIDFLRDNFGAVDVEPDNYSMDDIPELVEARKNTSSGEAIFLDRDLRGMTQAELAKKLGVAVSVVSDLENNRRAVSKKMAVKLSEVFGTSPSSYFWFEK